MRLNILTLELYEVETDFTSLAHESLSSMAILRHTEKDLYSMVLFPQTKGLRGPIKGFVSSAYSSVKVYQLWISVREVQASSPRFRYVGFVFKCDYVSSLLFV